MRSFQHHDDRGSRRKPPLTATGILISSDSSIGARECGFLKTVRAKGQFQFRLQFESDKRSYLTKT